MTEKVGFIVVADAQGLGFSDAAFQISVEIENGDFVLVPILWSSWFNCFFFFLHLFPLLKCLCALLFQNSVGISLLTYLSHSACGGNTEGCLLNSLTAKCRRGFLSRWNPTGDVWWGCNYDIITLIVVQTWAGGGAAPWWPTPAVHLFKQQQLAHLN